MSGFDLTFSQDVLIAMGVIDENVLGLEAAGIVLETGSDVDHVQVGDNVAVFWKSCLATEVVTKSCLCVKMAPKLRFDEAASMLCTYATVIRSLVDVGRLEKDQVGLALSLASLVLTIDRPFLSTLRVAVSESRRST